MSYELLTGLYFSETANAALTSMEARQILHVATGVEPVVVSAVERGLDVVLTGNPGDGKSHLIRTLAESGGLARAEVEDDLSAHPSAQVLERWAAAAKARKPFVLCANEGPLKDLLEQMSALLPLAARAAELRGQLGHLLVHRPEQLPPAPSSVLLIDLADRDVLDHTLIDAALLKTVNERFLPKIGDFDAGDCSAGRNLLLLSQHEECRRRLTATLIAAGRRCGEHVTFRDLWAAISYALTRAKPVNRLIAEASDGGGLLGTLPLDHLIHRDGRGTLLEAARAFADPAAVTDPDLDEQIWAAGEPSTGQWLLDPPPRAEAPALLWKAGERERALAQHAEIKRAVAFAHSRGELLIERLGSWRPLPSAGGDSALLRQIVDGLRSLYVASDEARAAPQWLDQGLPLWVGLSYEERPVAARPHVAVRSLAEVDFDLLRPLRPAWLEGALGGRPEEVWISHRASQISLRVDPALMHTLDQAQRSVGPVPTPEPVHRFLSRLAGWCERAEGAPGGGSPFAVIRHPRGELVSFGVVKQSSDGSYGYGLD